MASGTQNLTSDKARVLSTQPGTNKFWRGDNSWSNILGGNLTLEENNSWLSPARLQLLRPDTTAYTDRACIGVTDGNLHIDPYPNKGLYLNYYNSGGNVYFNGSTYYINGGNYNGNAASATRARYLTSPDTRSTNSAPTEYTATTTGVSFDFKQNSTIGLNAVSSQDYSGVMTYRPYSSSTDWSGGPAHQIAFDAVGLYWRTGTSSWNRWYKIFSNERMPMNSGLTGIASYGQPYHYGTIIYTNGISMRDPYTGGGNDCGFIRHIETTSNSGYLEIGVGDDGTEEILCRQYNTSSAVVRTAYLLDSSGMTVLSNSAADASYMRSALQIREANFVGSSSDTWGVAPRISFHWAGRVQAQIGLASNNHLYISENSFSNAYRIVMETGTWGINISGNAATASQLYVTGSSGTLYLTGVPAYNTANQTQYIYSPCYMSGGNLYAYNIYATSGWLRTYGDTGWYNESYGGGWYMSDSTWIRAYNSKSVYSPGEIQATTLRSNSVAYCNAGIECQHGVNFMVGGNEVNFIPDGYNSTFWFNYTTFNRSSNGTISTYILGDGHCGGRAGLQCGELNCYDITTNNISCNATVSSRGSLELKSSSGNRFAIQTDGNFVAYKSNGQVLWATGTGSSYKIKQNIQNINQSEIDNFMRLRPISFYYRPEMNWADKNKQYGVIAEELLLIYPELVTIPDNYQDSAFDINKGIHQPLIQVKYEQFIPLLIKMVQNQQREIEELKNQLIKNSNH